MILSMKNKDNKYDKLTYMYCFDYKITIFQDM